MHQISIFTRKPQIDISLIELQKPDERPMGNPMNTLTKFEPDQGQVIIKHLPCALTERLLKGKSIPKVPLSHALACAY